jgi:hypothetical protein
VEYRPGKLNGAADALSLREEDTAAVHSISTPTLELFDSLRDEIQHSPEAAAARSQLAGGKACENWSLVDGLVLSRGTISILDAFTLWPELLSHAHTVHEGVQKTVKSSTSGSTFDVPR